MEFTRVEDILKGKVSGSVSVRGWLHHKRTMGGVHFFLVRDGTGIIQTTWKKENVGEEVMEKVEKLPVESVIMVKGDVKEDKRAPGGYEIVVKSYDVISKAEEDYPIARKYHGPDFLLDHRHLYIRNEKMWAMLKVRAKMLEAAREWFKENGFTEFHAPIFTAAACEGGSTLFPVKYFGKTVYLTQSWQLYGEAAIASVGKAYTIAPSFRAEKSRTRRHLTEYWHLEVEEPFCDLKGTMKTQEELITHICHTLAEEVPDLLKMFGREPEYLLSIKPPFPKITYDEAIQLLKKDGVDIKWGDDLTWVTEKRLTMKFKVPFFVTHYPKSAKAFYHKPDPKRPEVVLCADMLAPDGYGEIIGGGERISDVETLIKRIKEEGLKVEDYKWYIDLRRWGTVPHAGFGLGVERFIMWVLKLDHIRDAIAFPRTINRVYP
ncbi:MAG: asparagine--tRNA ligase [Candidatus Aenigmarchaeota archaeon]|nr:asparagine--tRNA ligase [Candidatus Aenigmarchaeota archaeon]